MVMSDMRKRLDRSRTRTRPSLRSNSKISRRRSSLSIEISPVDKVSFCFLLTFSSFSTEVHNGAILIVIQHVRVRFPKLYQKSNFPCRVGSPVSNRRFPSEASAYRSLRVLHRFVRGSFRPGHAQRAANPGVLVHISV